MNHRFLISPDGWRGLIRAVESAGTASDQRSAVDTLMALVAAAGTPLVLDDTSAAFVYRGPGLQVRITGDMTNWSAETALDRIAESDLFAHVAANYPAHARFEYQLLVDDAAMPDPGCPHRVLHGLGANSELAMPAYEHRDVFASVRDGTPGNYDRVRRHHLCSRLLGYPVELHIYTPPLSGRGTFLQAPPCVYILDGRDYIEYAHVPMVLDDLIIRDRIRPVLAVFVSPPNRHQPTEPNRTTEYGLNPVFAQFVARELVPYVHQHYRAADDASSRLVLGDSYAGLASLYIPFEHPDVFGLGYSQSGYVSLRNGAIIEAYRASRHKPIRLAVDIGLYERAVGLHWLPDEETDFLRANRQFHAVLRDQGYDVRYREYCEGHAWGNWRAHVIDVLEHFFGT